MSFPVAISLQNTPQAVETPAKFKVSGSQSVNRRGARRLFPRLTINISGGTQDTGLSLPNFKNSVWQHGPAITLPIFRRRGARAADLAAAGAAYLQTIAQWRGVVLHAVQEVDDQLAALRWLAKEKKSRDAPRLQLKRFWTSRSRSTARAGRNHPFLIYGGGVSFGVV